MTGYTYCKLNYCNLTQKITKLCQCVLYIFNLYQYSFIIYMTELDFDLFNKAKKKLRDNDDPLAERLMEAVEDAYKDAGIQGVQELFIEIRKKYVGEGNET